MSQHEDDGSIFCEYCGVTFDCHAELSPHCGVKERARAWLQERSCRTVPPGLRFVQGTTTVSVSDLAALLMEERSAATYVLREALRPFIRPHCGLCVPPDEQGRMGEVTEESCVCDADQKRARAALLGGGE